MVIKKIGKRRPIPAPTHLPGAVCLLLFMAPANVLTVEIIDSSGACRGHCENETVDTICEGVCTQYKLANISRMGGCGREIEIVVKSLGLMKDYVA